MRHFNEGKDTSQFNYDETRLELTKIENKKQLQLNDDIKTSLLFDSNLKLPTVLKNNIKATKDQIRFKNDFDNNKLTDDYANIKPYFDANNALGFGLYKANKADSTKFYKIDESGKLSNE